MKPLISCPTDLLLAFLDSRLTEEQSSSIEMHIEACSFCQQTLDSQSGGNAFWSSLPSLSDDQFDRDLSSLDSGCIVAGGRCNNRENAAMTPKSQAALELIEGLLGPSDDPKSVGRIGCYEVLGLVGSGGMGIVLKVRDPSLDRVVALKILAPHLSVYESARVRFQREAKAAATIKHDGIIPIFVVDTHRGTPYFVMPYEIGPSLQQRINADGKLTVEESLRVAMQIADALAAAHKSGLVHRDIKPSNILLAPGTERALLTDFGLVQVASEQQITETGLLAGTPAFMSPEQARGEIVDSRSDLFSLGSVLFMMLTGQPPVDESTAYAVVRRIGGDSMPRVRVVDSTIPTWLDELVACLHATDTNSRIQTAEEAQTLLAECVALVQNPAQHRVPARLANAGSKHKIKRRMKWAVGFAIAITASWFASTFIPIRHRHLPPHDSNFTSNGLEGKSALNWDDGLGESVNEIRQRLQALKDNETWFLNSTDKNEKE